MNVWLCVCHKLRVYVCVSVWYQNKIAHRICYLYQEHAFKMLSFFMRCAAMMNCNGITKLLQTVFVIKCEFFIIIIIIMESMLIARQRQARTRIIRVIYACTVYFCSCTQPLYSHTVRQVSKINLSFFTNRLFMRLN